MPKNFDLIVFDWDGTLMDSAATIVSAIQKSAQDTDLPIPTDAAARHIIGLGLVEALTYLYGELSMPQQNRLVDRYRHHYIAASAHLPLFAGVDALLAALHEQGYKLAVATGKGRSGLDSVLASSGLRDYFHASRCADETFSKPHPAMLLELMDELDSTTERTLMIGDTSHDLQMAINAKVAAVGVAYGAHPREHLAALSPAACVNNVRELRAWLDANG